jgi:ABC-type Fe3+/spermidine/putrescine transport system ATPase subunit
MLDEPLGALDHALRVELMHELRRVLFASGKPAIYVTHDREEAFAIADRLAVLHNGKIIQTGTPQELFDYPANAWLAGFLALGNLLHANHKPTNPEQVTTALGEFALSKPCEHNFATNFKLLLRPQDMLILDNGTTGTNTFRARVLDSVFMGEFWHIQLESAGVSLEARAPQACKIGAEVNVSISPDKIQVLSE